jgi:hypothetical protein
MKFAPLPDNDFAEFIQIYYDECRARFSRIEAIGGKWAFRDLRPAMSDFDTRFICTDTMTPDDWCAMSMAVADVHLDLCNRHAHWARNLEHLPGINLTWSELSDEDSYYPEYGQWSFYHTSQPERLADVQAAWASRPWDKKDEYFHLSKFRTYFGRYNRTIDPPINMGAHVNKYGLHSRVMHYFSPPVMSAMSVLTRRNFPGKLDAFDMAEQMFPRLACWARIREYLDASYEIPSAYEEPALIEFEDELEAALVAIGERLACEATLLPNELGTDMDGWTRALQAADVPLLFTMFNHSRFSRLMKGRLYFYVHAPIHFDSDDLIGIEIRRIGDNFFRIPFAAYWKLKTGRTVENPETILNDMIDDPLTKDDVTAVREFARITASRDIAGRERKLALDIIDVFDNFYRALARLIIGARNYSNEHPDA